MTNPDDRSLPAELAASAAVGFDYDHGDGVDFEPFDGFLSADETRSWFRAWTGDPDATGDEFRVFGQDGSGGYAAFWLVRPQSALVDQPVVFLGSEGELGVVARDLAAYLWLLADGFGPFEAVQYPTRPASPVPAFTAIAERYAPERRQSASDVIAEAGQEFPAFEDTILELCGQ